MAPEAELKVRKVAVEGKMALKVEREVKELGKHLCSLEKKPEARSPQDRRTKEEPETMESRGKGDTVLKRKNV